MKKAFICALAILTAPSAFASGATFGQVRDVIKSTLGNGFNGINTPADRKACSVSVSYQSNSVILTITSVHPNDVPETMQFTAATDSNELVVSDQSAASGSGMLVYLTAGKYIQMQPVKKIDRRRLTIENDHITLDYMSRYNPVGTTDKLDCYRN